MDDPLSFKSRVLIIREAWRILKAGSGYIKMGTNDSKETRHHKIRWGKYEYKSIRGKL